MTTSATPTGTPLLGIPQAQAITPVGAPPMTWQAMTDGMNDELITLFGEAVTYARGTTTSAVLAVIDKLSDPWLSEGQIQISQHHYQAQIAIPALTREPIIGDTLTTAAGTVYVVDQPPACDRGLYRLVLRKRP